MHFVRFLIQSVGFRVTTTTTTTTTSKHRSVCLFAFLRPRTVVALIRTIRARVTRHSQQLH